MSRVPYVNAERYLLQGLHPDGGRTLRAFCKQCEQERPECRIYAICKDAVDAMEAAP